MHTNIQHLHDETLILPIHEHPAPCVTIQTETQHQSHPLHKHTTYFNTPRLKHYLYSGCYTTNITTDPHTVTTTDIKTNMRHIHTYIVSRHLATRGNNKILSTPPPHISSSEEILLYLSRRTRAPLRTINYPSSNHTYTKSTPNPIHHHYVPSVIVTSGIVDRPHRSDCTAGQMDGEAGWWTTSGNVGSPPPLARVMGVGRQQQQQQSAM